MRVFVRRAVQAIFWTAMASLVYVAMVVPAAINTLIFGPGI